MVLRVLIKKISLEAVQWAPRNITKMFIIDLKRAPKKALIKKINREQILLLPKPLISAKPIVI